MGFSDFLGKVADQTGQFIKEKNTQLSHQAKLKDFKRQILNQLTTDELKHISNHFAIEPRPPLDPSEFGMATFGETQKKKVKFVPTRDDYIQTLMGKLKATDIIDWCRNCFVA